MNKPRAYTKQEVRNFLYAQMKAIATDCANEKRRPDVQDKIELAMFSLLALFDGSCISMPGFDLVLRPHPEDKQYHIDQGQHYFEDGMVINDTELHHEFCNYGKKKK